MFIEKMTPNAIDPFAAKRSAHRRLHGGSSMSPTLRPADVLRVVPCRPESIAVGDVVVVEPEDGRAAVVHRVIAVDGRLITTKGDANTDRDPLPSPWDRILGKVVYVDGDDGVRTIHGGLRGRMTASAVTARSALARTMSRLLHRPYCLLSASRALRVLRRLLPEVRTVAFQRGVGVELQLFLGKTPIGILPAARSRWLIRRPYRLILDEGFLTRLLLERDKRQALYISLKRG